MILRIRSPDGTQRITISPSCSFSEFIDALSEKFSVPVRNLLVYRDIKDKNPIGTFKTKTKLQALNLNHGDMLFIKSRSEDLSNGKESINDSLVEKITPDGVDVILSKKDGLIQQKLNPHLCNHNENGRCVHCSPLEPYDEEYLAKHKIKHMSYYAYLKKKKSGTGGKFVQMEDVNCRIKPGCMKHPPWPEGICTQCQPNAVTLNQQEYRHCDYIEFEAPHIIENFIRYWRETGSQRVGFLYGRYEVEEHIPLGIKAVVSFVYEPPQRCSSNSVEFLEDDKQALVEELAGKLDLKRVGWIFTDLQALSRSDGTVRNLRHAKTYFLSAQECIHAAHFQNLHPSASPYSSSGRFGSKFVTVCVTGNSSNTIEMSGYQVSNQCMALVRDEILLPAREHPGQAYVKQSSSEQYVPDVFFREKDEYGNEVTKEARPLPVEYLLLQLPHGTPKSSYVPLLPGGPNGTFPILNRDQTADLEIFKRYYRSQPDEAFLETLADINVLYFLASNETLNFKESIGEICSAIKSRDRSLVEQFKVSPIWATFEQIISIDSDLSGGGETWACSTCTLINNATATACEVCGTPKC